MTASDCLPAAHAFAGEVQLVSEPDRMRMIDHFLDCATTNQGTGLRNAAMLSRQWQMVGRGEDSRRTKDNQMRTRKYPVRHDPRSAATSSAQVMLCAAKSVLPLLPAGLCCV